MSVAGGGPGVFSGCTATDRAARLLIVAPARRCIVGAKMAQRPTSGTGPAPNTLGQTYGCHPTNLQLRVVVGLSLSPPAPGP